jgi:hypothetical protein
MVRTLNTIFAGALFLLATGVVAHAQTCDTLLGKADCGGPSGVPTSSNRTAPANAAGMTGLSNQALGRGLSLGDDDQPGMFGALTFGGHGTTCSGPFRVRRC